VFRRDCCRPQKLTTGSGRLMPPLARDNTRGAVRREPASRGEYSGFAVHPHGSSGLRL